MRRPADDRTFVAALALAAVLLALRSPAALTGPWLRVEDAMFFEEQERLGFASALATRYAGYVHLVPRLTALGASLVPALAGWVFWAVAVAVGATSCAWLVRPEFRAFVPDDRARLVACVWLACQPVAIQLPLAVTNAQWYLLWLGFLLAGAPRPTTAAGASGGALAWILTGLSAPGSFALLPLHLARAARERGRDRAYALVCAAPILLMAALLDRSVAARPPSASFGHVLRFLARPLELVWAGEPALLGVPPWVAIAIGASSTALAARIALRAEEARPWVARGAFASVLSLAISAASRSEFLEAAEFAPGRYAFLTTAFVATLHAAAWSRATRAERVVLGSAALAALPACASAYAIAT